MWFCCLLCDLDGDSSNAKVTRTSEPVTISGYGLESGVESIAKTRMEIRTEIEIDAPPKPVWNALTDFSRYRDWNPFIARIEGELRAGAKLEVSLSPPGGSDVTIRPTLLVVEPEKELRWRGQLMARALFAGEHFFQLVPVAPSRTRLVHGEDFTGILVKALAGSITKAARGFVYMNQALKRHVESDAR